MVKPSHLWLMESTLVFVIAHPGSSRPAHKSGRPLHEISERFINLKAVPKTKIQINLPGRSALFLGKPHEKVHFFPENFGFWNSLQFIKYRVVRQNLNPETQVQILMEHTVSSGFEPDNSTFPGQTLIIQSVPTVFANLQV